MADQSGNPNHDVADYISTMTAQLAQMAAAENLILLTHLLEMAWLEAERLCGRNLIRRRAVPSMDNRYRPGRSGDPG